MIIDTNTSCLGRSAFLQRKGVTAVGRYYRDKTHSEWKISKNEAQELSRSGIILFMVFEDYGNANDLKLTKQQGDNDAKSALAQADQIGQPQGSAIYFAVEGLPHGYKANDLPQIRDYFAGVKAAIGSKYAIGVYGDGVVCKPLLDEGICQYSWLAAGLYELRRHLRFLRQSPVESCPGTAAGFELEWIERRHQPCQSQSKKWRIRWIRRAFPVRLVVPRPRGDADDIHCAFHRASYAQNM